MNSTIDNSYSGAGPARHQPAAEPDVSARRRTVVRTARALSSILLATVLSVLIVVSDSMVDAWSGGGLMFAVMVMWTVLFVGLVVFARLTGRVALRWATACTAWCESPAKRHARERLADPPRNGPPEVADVRVEVEHAGQDQVTRRPALPVYYRPW